MFKQETLYSFEKLYRETYHDVTRYVVCHCSHIEDVKDIIQDIYLDVLKNWQKLPMNHEKAYVLGISKNKVKDYYRFRYKDKIISLCSSKQNLNRIENIPSDIDIEVSISNQYDVEEVWKYLKKKPVIISKVFYLYYYLEFTIKEIAQELNIPESSIKNYLYRSLKELRKYVKKGEKR